MKRFYMTVAALALCVALVGAQAPPPAGQAAPPAQGAKKQPAPKTQKEYEALQALGQAAADPAKSPDDKIAMADKFLQDFADSDFKALAYRTQMAAYQQKNDFAKMLGAGEKALEVDPDDALVLISLASAIPERTGKNDLDKEQKLGQADDYAKRALVAIDKLAKPNPQMPDTDWDRVRNDARGQVHSAMGLIAIQREQYPAAEAAFKKALELQVQKDPIVLWRLGLTYEMAKKYEEAREVLKQSVAAGGVKAGSRDYAAEELQRVEDFLKKKQSGGAGPGTGTTPPPPAAGSTAPQPRP